MECGEWSLLDAESTDISDATACPQPSPGAWANNMALAHKLGWLLQPQAAGPLKNNTGHCEAHFDHASAKCVFTCPYFR